MKSPHFVGIGGMHQLIGIFLKGVTLGLGAAVPIGPVNVEIARRTLHGGFFAGFALGCGAVTVDMTYAILSSLGFRFLLDRPALYWLLTIGGVALLIYMGVMCWIEAARAMRGMSTAMAKRADAAPETAQYLPEYLPSRAHAAYVTGLLMT